MIHRRECLVQSSSWFYSPCEAGATWRTAVRKLSTGRPVLLLGIAGVSLIGLPWAITKLITALGGSVAIAFLRDVGKAVGGAGAAGAAGATAAGVFPGWKDWNPFGTGPSGFAYVTSHAANIYRDSEPGSPLAIQAPERSRFVYGGVSTDANGEITGYYVNVPGLPSGWVSAGDVSTTPPAPLQPAAPLKLIDSGLGNARATASMCICAHG